MTGRDSSSPIQSARPRSNTTTSPSLLELQGRVLELATLHTLQRTYASPATETIARSRLSDARRALGLDGLLILVHEEGSTHLTVVTADGIRGDVALGLATVLAERRRGFLTEPRSWPDLSKIREPFDDTSLPAEGSLAILPLRADQRGVGFLVLHAYRPAAMADSVIAALTPVAHSLATSLAAAAACRPDDHDGNVIPYRAAFLSALATRLRRAGDGGTRQTVLVIQVEELRQLLATNGAAAGKDAVEDVGTHLRGLLRSSDLLARLEGGRFAVALGECKEVGARAVAQKLREAIGAKAARYHTELGLSVGGVSCADASEEAEDLLLEAEELVNESLARGGGRTLLRSRAPVHAGAEGVD